MAANADKNVAVDSDAAVANGPRGPARVVTLAGKSTYRNVDSASAAAPRITGNNPVAGKVATVNSQDLALGAGPRAAELLQLAWRRRRLPPPLPLAVAAVRDNVGFAHAAAPCPGHWRDNVDWRTNDASAVLLVGKLHCNSVPADDEDETSVHSL